jgi:hypothetical protein
VAKVAAVEKLAIPYYWMLRTYQKYPGKRPVGAVWTECG